MVTTAYCSILNDFIDDVADCKNDLHWLTGEKALSEEERGKLENWLAQLESMQTDAEKMYPLEEE